MVSPPILPTRRDRIVGLDVMRGVAVLGILLANIAVFAWPTGADLGELVPHATRDAWIAGLESWLVAGKFRGMLATLFGVGLYLQFLKRSGVPGAWPKGYIIRSAYLLGIGLIHLYLVWFGDILALYALVAMIAALFVRLSDRMLFRWILALLAGSGLIALMQAAGVALSEFMPQFASSSGSKGFDFDFTGWQTTAYGEGGYLAQLLQRLVMGTLVLFSAPFIAVHVLLHFLAGFLLVRRGIAIRPSGAPNEVRRVLGWCLGLGLPLNALGFVAYLYGGDKYAEVLVDGFLSIPLGIGYLVLGLWLVERVRWKAIFWPVESVGRFALTCYLLQSVICTFIFYSGWGLGYYRSLDWPHMLGVAGLVALAVTLWACLWRLVFAMGPIEWAWRSAIARQRLPILLARAPIPAENSSAPAPPDLRNGQ